MTGTRTRHPWQCASWFAQRAPCLGAALVAQWNADREKYRTFSPLCRPPTETRRPRCVGSRKPFPGGSIIGRISALSIAGTHREVHVLLPKLLVGPRHRPSSAPNPLAERDRTETGGRDHLQLPSVTYTCPRYPPTPPLTPMHLTFQAANGCQSLLLTTHLAPSPSDTCHCAFATQSRRWALPCWAGEDEAAQR